MYILIIILNIFTGSMFTWSALTNIDLDLYLSYFSMSLKRFVIIFSLLVLIESTLLRSLTGNY